MFLHFAKLWNWKSLQQGTDTVPYVSTFCQVMKLGNLFSRYWYCLLGLWINFFGNAKKIYFLASYESGKSLQHITDTVLYVSAAGRSVQEITDTLSYVSTFLKLCKLRNQFSTLLILSLMFLHFATLWNWEISAADNWYFPLYFYVLPSYETAKSVQQILILSLMFMNYLFRQCQENRHFAKLWNWEISAADNWYCPLCFYILPSYEAGNQCSG